VREKAAGRLGAISLGDSVAAGYNAAMRYSLRSLMVAVAVTGIVLGRIAHLKRWAEYHDREAERLVSEKVAEGWTRESVSQVLERKFDDWQLTTYGEITTHLQLAKEYRAAMYRPWTIVKERPPPPRLMQSSAS
jgi:hypothetical protein